MDENCEELSNIQSDDDDKISETQDDDEEEYDDDEDEDGTVSTSKSLNDQKVEENTGSGNDTTSYNVSVKLEMLSLEGEENQNASKDQQDTIDVKNEAKPETDEAAEHTPETEPPGYDIYKNITEEQREAVRKHNECFICQKRFGTFATFKRHIIRHTGLKNYKCHICGEAFAEGSYLKAHLMTHSGTTPCSCDICLKKFANSSSLHGHIKRMEDFQYSGYHEFSAEVSNIQNARKRSYASETDSDGSAKKKKTNKAYAARISWLKWMQQMMETEPEIEEDFFADLLKFELSITIKYMDHIENKNNN